MLGIAALQHPLKSGCKVELQSEVLEHALFGELVQVFSDFVNETSVHYAREWL